MHYMSVKQRYFRLLKDGKKSVELRLFDEKRQKIKMGDFILFSNADDMKENFQAKVVDLTWAKDFDTLLNKVNLAETGFQTKNELLTTLDEFYPETKQEKFGVLGIKVNTNF